MTLKRGQHIKHPLHVFSEHGAIMVASVLNSRVAVQASVYVVRAFVQMRAAFIEYAHVSRRIDALEEKYDGSFKAIFDAIRELMMLPQGGDARLASFELAVTRRRISDEH